MNIKYINQMTSYNFSENFNLSLTPEQKKIATLAAVIFSCVALTYYFYRFCRFGTNNKRNDNPDVDRPKREQFKESPLEEYSSRKQEAIKRKNKQFQETSKDTQDVDRPKAFASGKIEKLQVEDDFSPKQEESKVKDKKIQDDTFAKSPQHKKLIQIFIKDLYGKLITIDTPPDTTIADIKDKIQAKMDIPVDVQRLLFAGKQLEDNKTLKQYHIQECSTMHLVEKLRGD